MGEVDWLPGIITLGLALTGGVLAVLLLRKTEQSGGGPTVGAGEQLIREQQVDDLRQRKTELMAALRDAMDRSSGAEAELAELRKLELAAARVARDLERAESRELDQRASALASGAPATKSGPEPKATPQGSASGAFNAFRWMATGAFLPLVAISLYFGVSERADESVPMTGGNPALSRPVLPTPTADQPGGPVKGVPPSLRPQPSAELDQARALVAAHPEDPEAWSALGWALVKAEGWIDVFEASRKLRALDPKHPDAFVLEASVRVTMGQQDIAQGLITDALSLAPQHIQALSFQGALAMRRGDPAAAQAAWKQALDVAGPGRGFEELIAMAKNGGPRTVPSAQPRPSSSPTAGRASPAAALPTTAQEASISGQVVLAAGAPQPNGGILFIIARPKGMKVGPPAAAKRIQVTGYPVRFNLSATDAMMGGPLPTELSVSARLDSDGNAGTRSPDDLVAAPVDVRLGQQDLTLTLASKP